MSIVSSFPVLSTPASSIEVFAGRLGWCVRTDGRLQPSSPAQVQALYGPAVAELAAANPSLWIAVEADFTPAPTLAGSLPVGPLLALEVEGRPGDWMCVGTIDAMIDGEPVTIAAAEEMLLSERPHIETLMGDARRRFRVLSA